MSTFVWSGVAVRWLVGLVLVAVLMAVAGIVLLLGGSTASGATTTSALYLDDFTQPQILVKACDNIASTRQRVELPVLGLVDRQIGGGALSGNPAGEVTFSIGSRDFSINSHSNGGCTFSFPAPLVYFVVGEPADLSGFSKLIFSMRSGTLLGCDIEIETQPFAVYSLALGATLSSGNTTVNLHGIPNLDRVSALTVGKNCVLAAHDIAVMASILIE